MGDDTVYAMTQTLTERLGVKPGDIYTNSWGYDQTNIDFYKVVRVTATKAEIVPIGAIRLEDDGTRGTMNKLVPNPDYVREYDVILRIERSDEKKSKLCKVKGRPDNVYIVLESGRHWASPWDGKPEYETDSHFGH